MINAVVTRGFLFTPELIMTAGYVSGASPIGADSPSMFMTTTLGKDLFRGLIH